MLYTLKAISQSRRRKQGEKFCAGAGTGKQTGRKKIVYSTTTIYVLSMLLIFFGFSAIKHDKRHRKREKEKRTQKVGAINVKVVLKIPLFFSFLSG